MGLWFQPTNRKIVSWEDNEVIDVLKSVKNQVLPQDNATMPYKYSEDSKNEKSQTSAMLKYNLGREESDGNKNKEKK